MYTYYTNLSTLSGSDFVFILKEGLKTAGWTVRRSGGGSAGWFSSSSDGFSTTGSATTQGLNPTSAWFTIRDPNGFREFLFQRGATLATTNWKIFYSADGVGFVTGSANATVAPSASDGVQVLGTNGATATLLQDDFTYWGDIAIGDAAEEYSFYALTRLTRDGVGNADIFALDILKDPNANDADPAVVVVNATFGDTLFRDSETMGGGFAYGWYKKNTDLQRFVTMGGSAMFADIAGTTVLFSAFSVDPYNGKFPALPIWYIKNRSTYSIYKGRSRLFKQISRHSSGGPFTTAGSIGGGIGNTNSAKTKLYLGMVSVPYSGTVLK